MFFYINKIFGSMKLKWISMAYVIHIPTNILIHILEERSKNFC